MRPAPIAALLLGCVLARSSAAACLLSNYSVAAEWARSEAVIVATVQSQRSISDAADPEGIGGTVYSVSVRQAFRGSVAKSVDVYSENSSGRFDLAIGQEYLLFLYRERGYLSADPCGNSGLTRNRRSALKEVQRLSSK